MSTIGWIVPTWPPREAYVKKLKESFNIFATDVDLIIVWSRKKDNFLRGNDKIKSLFLDDYFSSEDIELFELTKSIINVKKIFGLLHEYQNYKGLICTDDEIEFVRSFNGLDLLDRFTNFKYFPATDISISDSKNSVLKKILMESSKLLITSKDRARIASLTHNFTLYSWFSDLPYYNPRDIPNFLGKFGIFEYKDLIKLSFYTFDHILYQYYCILYLNKEYVVCNWEYTNTKIIYNWFECFHVKPLNHEYINEYQTKFPPSWSSSKELLDTFTRAICVFHTDRSHIHYSSYFEVKHHLKKILMIVFPLYSKISK